VFRILNFVLCGCETWYLTLKENVDFRVAENRVMRIIVGHSGVSDRNWRRLHDEEFNSFYISQNIIRMIRSRRIGWAKHVACV
jgi:hypothetical protein